MFGLVEITAWHWTGFIVLVLFCLALDLGVFHRRAHVVGFREAMTWSAVWFIMAMIFTVVLRFTRGDKESIQFATGYLIELSLSMDNVFVIALIFSYFRIPPQYQHRVLYWGILGALIMRGLMIGIGVALISLVDWILYVFGAFLLYSGCKMIFVETKVDPEHTPIVRWVRKFYPVSPELDGEKFFTHWQGARALTPLALVLVMIEATDLLFAVDSIPAVFAVTRKPFIVFTSNVFAILGLRSLYFVLAGAIGYFRYLKYGLPLVLVFMGVEMLIDPHERPRPQWRWFQYDIPPSVSLLVVGGILGISIVLSIFAARREEKQKREQAALRNREQKQIRPGE
jgi:tellurite resistance protein TerC